MAHHISRGNSSRWRTCRGIGLALLLSGSLSEAAYADESGISYWLPGRFSSLAATPQVPGWSMAAVYYHTSVEAFGAVAAARQIQIGRFPANVNVDFNARLNAQADDMQGYVNLKGYGEFDAANRPSGWNTWLTFSISPMAPTSTVTPTRRMVTK
jgi:hypothetical protein